MMLEILTLFEVFMIIYGQTTIPAGIRQRCYISPNCAAGTITVDSINTASSLICCFDGIPPGINPDQESYQLDDGECRLCNDLSILSTAGNPSCFTGPGSDQCEMTSFSHNDTANNGFNDCCNGGDTSTHYVVNGVTGCEPCFSLTPTSTPGVGNDPHFLLPLPNGDHMCFSIQGQPNFAFSLISDKYIQLNGLFVQPTEEESHKIFNVSTFIGDLGLVLKNRRTVLATTIEISSRDHSLKVGNSVTIVKDKPVIVDIYENVYISISEYTDTSKLKDSSAWLYINTDGFGIKVRFYKKHLDMFLTNTSGLTKEANGIIGQFLTASIHVDEDGHLMKLNGGKPIPVRKGPIWPFMGIAGECWYGTDTDNQATGIIRGVYTDYIVEDLLTPAAT